MAAAVPRPAPRLRPLSLGDLLNEVFALYRAHFAEFVQIAALAMLPAVVLRAIVSAMAPPFGVEDVTVTLAVPGVFPLGRAIVWLALGGIAATVTLIAYSFMEGALTYAISREYLGRRATPGEAFAAARARLRALVLWPILAGVAIVVISLVFLAALAILANTIGGDAGVGLGVAGGLLLLGLLIWVGIRLALTPVAIVLERLGAVEAMNRSWSLVEGHGWRVFLTGFVLALIVGVLGAIPAAIGDALTGALGGNAGSVIRTIFEYIEEVLFTPVMLIGYTLLYYDLRSRKEGFDVAALERHVVAEAPDQARL